MQDLKVYAQPLADLCDDHVAAEIENTIQKAVVKWNETNSNLKQVCDNYKGAVRLWRKYCVDSQALRTVFDEQFSSVENIMQNKPFEEIQVFIFKLNQNFNKQNYVFS